MILDAFYVFDIETAANDRCHDYYKNKTYEAPSNYKDPVKIEQAITEKRQADMERAALSWWTGRVTCVCSTPLNGPKSLIGKQFSGMDERQTLINLFDDISVAASQASSLTLIGKRSDDFDRPFLIGRAMVYDLGIPDCLRPWGKLTDIEKIFGFSASSSQRGRLADYAWGLNILGKSGTGQGALALWLDIQMGVPGAWEALVSYCQRDVAITHEILRRYLKPYIARNLPKEPELNIPFAD